MPELMRERRNYQAEVHFALGAVIQGIIVAALGDEVASVLRTQSLLESIPVFFAAAQSLLICIVFWYRFMDDYFFGFRVLVMTANTHFFFACLYLVLGLQQLVAIRFVDAPRAWMTLYVLLIATTVLGSRLVSARAQIINEAGVRAALDYDPGSKMFLATYVASVLCLVLWNVIPAVNVVWFHMLALTISAVGLVLLAVFSIRVFRRHLDVGREVT